MSLHLVWTTLGLGLSLHLRLSLRPGALRVPGPAHLLSAKAGDGSLACLG